MAGEENVANLEGGETGFRRTGGSAGGYRGPRTGGGERRSGGFRSGPGAGGFRPRRSNDPDHPREFDRHSGSEKTYVSTSFFFLTFIFVLFLSVLVVYESFFFSLFYYFEFLEKNLLLLVDC